MKVIQLTATKLTSTRATSMLAIMLKTKRRLSIRLDKHLIRKPAGTVFKSYSLLIWRGHKRTLELLHLEAN